MKSEGAVRSTRRGAGDGEGRRRTSWWMASTLWWPSVTRCIRVTPEARFRVRRVRCLRYEEECPHLAGSGSSADGRGPSPPGNTIRRRYVKAGHARELPPIGQHRTHLFDQNAQLFEEPEIVLFVFVTLIARAPYCGRIYIFAGLCDGGGGGELHDGLGVCVCSCCVGRGKRGDVFELNEVGLLMTQAKSSLCIDRMLRGGEGNRRETATCLVSWRRK